MLPQVQTTQRPNRPNRNRPRPISPQDNAATTGMVVNPVGTYVTAPGTDVYGMQGATYATLPQVNVNNNFNQPLTAPSPSFLQPQAQPAPFMTSQQARSAGLMSQQQTQPYSLLAGNNPYRPQQPAGNFMTQSQLAGSPVAQGFGTGLNQQSNVDNIMMRLAQGDDPSQLSPAERSALESIIAGQQQPVNPNQPYGGYTQQGGSGNTDFANTASQQYYNATGTNFVNQERWDPSTKKYVKIGQLIRQGKLDVKTGKFYPNGRNRNGRNRPDNSGGGQPAAQAATPIPSFGVVNMNLNTATG